MRFLLVLLLVATSAHAAPEPTEEDLIAVITIQPRAKHAEANAILLLDRLARAGRVADRRAWLDRMLAMPQLLRGREQLALRLQNDQIQGRFLDARIFMARARRSHDRADWRRAGNEFLATAALSRKWSTSTAIRDGFHVMSMVDEATFYASICFDEAGEIGLTLQLYSAVTDGERTVIVSGRGVSLLVRAPLLIHREIYEWLVE